MPGSAVARSRLAALEAMLQQELVRTPRLPTGEAPGQDDPPATLVAWDLAFCRRAGPPAIE
ncbi:MAG: hypothetical protein J0H05_09690 [Stenotrophomonas acidaminiphila]|uniref:hypothetical protein n=1 Tax=Stenotrophomonas acidaminiphila TaxID=128780 RepID=UPI001ACD5CDB|nr:hypothetical protein [Stenotrophomonas acidaminiphila]MBN8801924.1 hypothetical protein [Stenotrophomonas acidaminiphila]MDF9441330.1 hypothetical protein [Stenotrophomonas acidaminiphila]